jgi:aspartyl-tRNA(Asn)/glutamyl-tRNA(Gln) amidotransferase subunit A
MPKYSALTQIQTALRTGQTTCRALVEHYLQRIEATRHLNAYVEVWAEEALQLADRTDQSLASAPDQLGRLFGCVVSIKDNICYAGHVTTAGAKILEGYRSPFSATAVERLLAEGAIIIGRTNCDQFGMGSSNENSAYGPVLHPLDETRVPGGSSGGAAVSVLADTCLMALGSDTGGSIRQPAGFCGVWGYKPSYGRVSRHGLIAYGSSFDQIGAIGHSPTDLALFLEVCAGADEFDSTATARPVPTVDFGQKNNKKYNIAYLANTVDNPGIDLAVRAATLAHMDQLRAQGHTLTEVPFDLMDYVIPAYYVLTTAEASSNLSRFDGMRYGYRSPQGTDIESVYLASRSEGFSREVKKRIMLGAFVLSSGYYDAYYTKAQRVRRMLHDRVAAILEAHDAILLPVAPGVAWRFGEKSADPTAMYLSDIYTVSANLCGVPAVAYPIAQHPHNAMPIGAQLMGAMYRDAELLQMAHQLQHAL